MKRLHEVLAEQIKHEISIKEATEVKLEKTTSALKIIEAFLRYCPNGDCYTIVSDSDLPASTEEYDPVPIPIDEFTYPYEIIERDLYKNKNYM